MFWYLKPLIKYADFSGRSGRREYWGFTLVNAAISYGLGALLSLILSTFVQVAVFGFVLVFSLVMFLPDWAVTVRRLHDTDHSGWAVLIALVPLVGWFVLLIWLVQGSDVDQNKYGPDPIEWAVSRSEGVSGAMIRRFCVILTLAVVLAGLLVGGLVFAARRGTEEARALAPWPAAEAPAVGVANLDLSAVGLQTTGKRDARSIYGEAFVDGAVVEYGANGMLQAIVAALRYSDSGEANSEFDGLEGWARENCATWASSHIDGAGVLHCNLSESHDMILLSDNWILDIQTAHLGELAAPELADRISAAAAQHWRGLSGGL